MALLPQEFNAEEVEPSVEFTLLPAGEYIAEIVDADLEETDSGTGQYVKVEYELTDCEQNGAYVGRHYWDTFNLVNDNPTAVEIAQREFSSLCRALGKMVVADTDELVDTPALGLKIKVKKANKKQIDKGYPDDTNKTVAWKKLQPGTSESIPDGYEEDIEVLDAPDAPIRKTLVKKKPATKPTAPKTATNSSHPWKK